MHVDGAAKCRDSGEAIDDGVVVGFGQRFGVGAGREAARRSIGKLEGGGLAECELKLAIRLERFAQVACLLERRRQADGGLIGLR